VPHLAAVVTACTLETKHQLARVALRSARKLKSVPIKSAKDLRDDDAAIIALEGGSSREGEFTLNVLNVDGLMNVSP
jgi:hypothetical protein